MWGVLKLILLCWSLPKLFTPIKLWATFHICTSSVWDCDSFAPPVVQNYSSLSLTWLRCCLHFFFKIQTWGIDCESFSSPLKVFNIITLIKKEKVNFLRSWKYYGGTIYFLNKENIMDLMAHSSITTTLKLLMLLLHLLWILAYIVTDLKPFKLLAVELSWLFKPSKLCKVQCNSRKLGK